MRIPHLLLLASALAAVAPAPALAAPPTTVSGQLQEVHGHRLDGSEVDLSWRVVTATGAVALAERQDPELVGRQVTLTDGDTQARGMQGRARPAASGRAAAAPPSGPRSVLVLIIKTPDKPAPASAATARQAVFTASDSVNAFYAEQSGGATSLTGLAGPSGDVAEVTISQPMAGCDYRAIAAAARSAADAAGWNTAAYDHRLYLHPRSADCNYGGLGTVPGSDTWSNGYTNRGLVAHELGHNMGAHHANALDCVDGSGGPVALSANCTSAEYADPFDVMGGDGLMGAWHREQIGQLPAADTVSLRQAASLTLTAVDGAPSGLKNVMVPIKEPRVPVTSWYSLDFRAPSVGPFNWFTAGSPATTGVTIRIVPRLDVRTQSQLIDTNANSARSHGGAPLQPGRTFSDAAHAITIQTRAAGSGTVGVDVSMPQLVDDVPPSAVGFLSARGDTNRVDLSWDAATDDEALARYEVTRDGASIGATEGLSFTDRDTAALGSVTYAVTAVDASGNVGPVTAQQLTLPDATPPSAIAGLTAVATPSAITLSWPAASDNRAVTAYRVARDGTAIGSPATTSFADRPPAGRHTYVVQAADAAGNLGPAASVQATMPSASSAPTTTTTTSTSVPTPTPFGPAAATPAAGGPPSATRSAARAAFRISSRRTQRLSGGRRRLTVTFACTGASSMRAFLRGRRIARGSTARLRTTFTMSRRQRRATVLVKAEFRDGTAQRRWVFR